MIIIKQAEKLKGNTKGKLFVKICTGKNFKQMQRVVVHNEVTLKIERTLKFIEVDECLLNNAGCF